MVVVNKNSEYPEFQEMLKTGHHAPPAPASGGGEQQAPHPGKQASNPRFGRVEAPRVEHGSDEAVEAVEKMKQKIQRILEEQDNN